MFLRSTTRWKRPGGKTVRSITIGRLWAEHRRANGRSTLRLRTHALFYVRFRGGATTRAGRRWALAFGRRSLSGRRGPRARCRLSMLSRLIRVARGGNRLLPNDHGASHLRGESAE